MTTVVRGRLVRLSLTTVGAYSDSCMWNQSPAILNRITPAQSPNQILRSGAIHQDGNCRRNYAKKCRANQGSFRGAPARVINAIKQDSIARAEDPNMASGHVLTEIKDGIATITLNRPEKLNAFSGSMAAELYQGFADFDANDDVRVIVVTGAGRAF